MGWVGRWKMDSRWVRFQQGRQQIGLRSRVLLPAVAFLAASDLMVCLLQGLTWRGFFGCLLVAVLFGFATWKWVVQALQPIEKLAQRLRALAQEESGIGGRIEVQGYADMVAIANDFNTLMERLQVLVDPLASRVDPLVSAVNRLTGFSNRMPGQLATMQATSNKVMEATQKAYNDLAGISGSLQDVSACIGMLSSSANEIAKSLSGVAVTCQSEVDLTGKAREEAQTATRVMEGLSHEAEAVGGILSEIQAIASRTRLLALNATIEAARAGEAGRGFAVVAGEVKELSGQTASSTERIRGMIGSIQAATRSAVEAMERISQRVGEVDKMSRSIEESVRKQTATIAEISENVNFVDEQAATISGVVTESGLELSGTTAVIAELREPLRVIDEDAKLVGEQSEELARLGVELSNMVQAFKHP